MYLAGNWVNLGSRTGKLNHVVAGEDENKRKVGLVGKGRKAQLDSGRVGS